MKVSGLDVHKDTVFCAIYDGKKYGEVKEYYAFSQDIRNLGKDLQQAGVRKVAIESTGIYWIPVWNILEEKYGIDKVKEVCTDSVKFIMKVGEARDADGPKGKKISLTEAVGLALFAVPKAMDHINDAEKIKNQLRDADRVERQEVTDHVVAETNLKNEKIEFAVDESLIALNSLGNAIEAVLDAKEPDAA